MTAEIIDLEYELYLVLWLVLPAFLFVLHTRRGGMGGFLVYTYILGFLAAHWFGAVAHASPWSFFDDSTDTVLGFKHSSYALIAFALGTFLIDVFRGRRRRL